MVYDPSAALVVVATMVPRDEAVIAAPLTGAPPVARTTAPAMEPGITTVNGTPLLGCPPTVTTTLPLVAPVGTTASIVESDQSAIRAATPLKVTPPPDAPKLTPRIVTPPAT